MCIAAGSVTGAFHHFDTASCIETPLTLNVKNASVCASQCVWQEWMNAPFPGLVCVGPALAMMESKSVMYWFIATSSVALQLSGSLAQAFHPGAALQTPFAVPS